MRRSHGGALPISSRARQWCARRRGGHHAWPPSGAPRPDTELARSAHTSDADHAGIATRDHEAIRQWGARHGAEPATGEATASGPATVHVRDGGAGIRLNFPGAGRFRPITWDEWFENFERHHLTFVYEEEIADRAYAVWEARGGGHGQDRDDWFEAERQMPGSARPMSRYRIMNVETISAGPF